MSSTDDGGEAGRRDPPAPPDVDEAVESRQDPLDGMLPGERQTASEDRGAGEGWERADTQEGEAPTG
ncbi:MAG: hypothetical protein M3O70_19680 [Actinomycetota bacterium]|nr:hypothetical protein [Actinomycetota bacterium]